MKSLKIGIRLESFGLPLRRALQESMRLGVSGVQVDAIGDLSPRNLSATGRREFRNLLRTHNLELTALAVHAGSLVIFATASGVPALLAARVVQGLSTGAALGAIGAAMLDMDRELGTFGWQLMRDPVRAIDFEFVANQIVGVTNDHAICFGIQVDDVTRPERSAGKSFALANREEFDAVVFRNKVSVYVVDFTAMKFLFTEMRTQERFVIISRICASAKKCRA